MNWKAPPTHSRKDWIGIYRVCLVSFCLPTLCTFRPCINVSFLIKLGANKSNLVTNTSSLGMWAPVHDDEWDGDIPLGSHKLNENDEGVEEGQVVLKGDRLPWQIGKYEVSGHLCNYVG